MQHSADDVVRFLRNEAGRPLKAKELAKALGVPSHEYPDFRELLARLEENGLIFRVKRQRYAAPEKINLLIGRLQTIRSGAGFIVPEDGAKQPDLFVPPNGMGSAMDGDRVVARIERRRRGQRTEGRVIEVLERARRTIVGAYQRAHSYGFVAPSDRKLSRDVFVPPGQESGAQDGDVVVVRVSNWGDEHRGPTGIIEQVLGRPGDPGVDVLTILHAHELPFEFSPEVEEEAEAARERGLARPLLAGREDLRELLVFTIDPADARDHDDALSIRAAGDDLWEVGIHIADVAAYVPAGGAMDLEAMRRGTSVYLVDRVVPMLPSALSADLCSLRAGEERLALSLILVMDLEANVRSHRLVRSLIRSRHALSYDDAQAVLDGARSVDAETDEALQRLRDLSQALRRRRMDRGSLDFDLAEARVILDARGEPTDIERVLRLESHRLIEDLMLLANETVAKRATTERLPFLYRVHERPDASRLEQLAELVAAFGIRLRRRGDATPRDLKRLLAEIEGRPEQSLVSAVALRSMKRARYSHENAGHFGLASEDYTHFTSPIRRYPDLVVHRLAMRAFVDGERIDDGVRRVLPEIARIASERERAADAAERDSIELKKVEFMERHLGDAFDGTVSGITSFGMFVLLDDVFVEGMVHVSSLEDDYYVFMEDRFMLVGERTRRRFRLGDRLQVQVAAVDRAERRIEFVPASDA